MMFYQEAGIMLSIEQIRLKLKDRRIRMVAKDCRISHQALYNLMKGAKATDKTIRALSEYLER